ncbi:MAG: type II toxin-antitoxin system RelE/ParE family toxin [Leptospirales bacterium]
MTLQVHELLEEDGSSPYAEWFQSLNPAAAAKIAVAKVRMEQGNLSNVRWFRGIGEYRIDWCPGYRIYLAKEGERIIILLGGGTKKGQQDDIDRAVKLWEDYRNRRKNGQKGSP